MRIHHHSYFAAIPFLLLLLFAGCSSVDVQKKETPSADLNLFWTYAWANTGPASDPDLDQKIKEAADEKFSEIGLVQLTPAGNPDFYVIYDAEGPELHFQFMDSKTRQIIWKARAHSSDYPKAAQQIVSHYEASRDKPRTPEEEAKFFLNIR